MGLACAAGCSSATPERSSVPRFEAGLEAETAFLHQALWDDGNAEVAKYDVREPRYGIMRDGEATVIVVKEDFDADALVKADGSPPDHRVTVMKLNTVLTVPAGVYTYRQMSSAFITRTEGKPVKLTVGSQEWCGMTSKKMEVESDQLVLEAWSYFGAEGNPTFRTPAGARTVLADALPLWLRTLDRNDTSAREVTVYPAQMSNRAVEPDPYQATVRIGEPQALEVPAGSIDSYPVRVTAGDKKATYWFMTEFPHTMVRWERADGGQYDLRWVRRAPYWDMNSPEHREALVPDGPATSDASEPSSPQTSETSR